eukprot:7214341-Pyramimonas_sp.AAC.1
MDRSDTGSAGIFSRWTDQIQDVRGHAYAVDYGEGWWVRMLSGGGCCLDVPALHGHVAKVVLELTWPKGDKVLPTQEKEEEDARAANEEEAPRA